MLDFYLLSIIGLGLIGIGLTFRMARRKAAVDKNVRKAMQFDHNRADHP